MNKAAEVRRAFDAYQKSKERIETLRSLEKEPSQELLDEAEALKNKYLTLVREFNNGVVPDPAFSDFVENIFIAKLKLFRQTLERYKELDDEFDALYEAGKKPTVKESHEFERLKKEYVESIKFFNRYDANIFGSEWTPSSIASTLVTQILGTY